MSSITTGLKGHIEQYLKQNKFLSKTITYETLIQFSRYLITGFTSAGLEYSTYILLTRYAGIGQYTSNSISMFIGFWASFLLNTFWSFNAKSNIARQLGMYSILFFINLGVSSALLYLLTDYAALPNWFSKILVMGAIVMWNFIIYKKIIFRKKQGG